jgi:hypothetical protein
MGTDWRPLSGNYFEGQSFSVLIAVNVRKRGAARVRGLIRNAV